MPEFFLVYFIYVRGKKGGIKTAATQQGESILRFLCFQYSSPQH